jgi:hypothetical protein
MSSGNYQILDGMEVFDQEGTKIGKIVRYDKTLGYFETQGTFSGARYIPFWALERIGPSGAHLNVVKSVVSEVYKRMPSITPDVAPDGRLTGGGTVQSGRSGQIVPLDAAALSVVREKIHIGTKVLDADYKNLGSIQAYDSDTGYMRIEKEGLTIKDIFLPVTSVSYLDDEGIHLSESKDTIKNRFSRLPEVAREFFASWPSGFTATADHS